MAGDILSIAASGLLAAQRSMTTTGHNIANVNTPNFSRQRAELTSAGGDYMGSAGFSGSGVNVQAITRSYSDFVNTQVRASTSAHAALDTYQQLTSEIDNFIGDSDTSLSPALQQFFAAVHGVVNEPTSIPVRRVLMTSAETLVNRFNVMSRDLDDLRDRTNTGLRDAIDQVNALATDLADINERISIAYGIAGGNPPNDLLDQREKLLTDLAKQVDIQVLPQDDKTVSVFMGSGQSLVMGNRASSLELIDSTYVGAPKDIALYPPGGSSYAIVTNQVSGGIIGGYQNFIGTVLDTTQNDLGRVATALSSQFNTQHRLGYDLNGNTAIDFFNTPSVTVMGKGSNTLAPIPSTFATISNFSTLTAQDYQLDITATGTTITNMQTGAITSYPSATTAGYPVFVHEGVQFDVTGAATGDSFLVLPTRHAGADLELASTLTDPSMIAASLSDTSTPATPPPGGPRLGDNRNALALANLQTNRGLLNGRATYQDAYNQTIGNVGTLAKSAEINVTAQKNLLDAAIEKRDSVSGVNLDEEAATLIRFQQAYTAAAQMVSTAQSAFDALIGAMR